MPRYKRNKDGYFRETFTVPGTTASGNPKRVTVRDADEKVFKRKLAEARRQYGAGLSAENITVAEWSEQWLRVYKANASETQKAHYSAKMEHDILPAVGNMGLRDVRPSHLQSLLNNYAGGKVGTVQKIRGALQQLFNDAEIEGFIIRSPAAHLELPPMEEVSRRPLTRAERLAVFEVAKTHKDGTYFLTMLFCGLRRGECCALTVGDVDLQKRRIVVNKALLLHKNVGEVSSTKAAKLRKRNVKNASDIGTRTVPIPDILVPFLVSQCSGRKPDDILFPKTPGGNEYTTKQTASWRWRSYARACHILLGAKIYRNQVQLETSPFGADVTPHYLRHTYATDLYAAGVDETAQKHFLGHSSSDVTDIYRKMTDAGIARALGLLDEYYADQCYLPLPAMRTSESLRFCLACERPI